MTATVYGAGSGELPTGSAAQKKPSGKNSGIRVDGKQMRICQHGTEHAGNTHGNYCTTQEASPRILLDGGGWCGIGA